MAGYLSVKNFDQFQHYRDRKPPWIKLYNDLLDDYAFACLHDASKMHLVAIWLLASRSENRVPADPKWIARMIHATEPVDLEPLVSAGFITMSQDASKALAERKQSAMPETETETETEGETETDTPPIGGGPPAKPKTKAKPKKTPMPEGWEPNEKHRELARREGRDFDREVFKFRDKAGANAYRYADWDKAFSSWLRNENYRGPSNNGRTPATEQPALIRESI